MIDVKIDLTIDLTIVMRIDLTIDLKIDLTIDLTKDLTMYLRIDLTIDFTIDSTIDLTIYFTLDLTIDLLIDLTIDLHQIILILSYIYTAWSIHKEWNWNEGLSTFNRNCRKMKTNMCKRCLIIELSEIWYLDSNKHPLFNRDSFIHKPLFKMCYTKPKSVIKEKCQLIYHRCTIDRKDKSLSELVIFTYIYCMYFFIYLYLCICIYICACVASFI